MEEVFAYGKRFNAGLTEDQLWCEGEECIEVSPEWEANDGALKSSDPECPIIDVKMMYDDGNGIPLKHQVDPELFRFVKEGTKIRSISNNARIKKALESGEKLNFVLIASTAAGPYTVPGQMLTFGFTLPVEADSSTGGVKPTPTKPESGATDTEKEYPAKDTSNDNSKDSSSATKPADKPSTSDQKDSSSTPSTAKPSTDTTTDKDSTSSTKP